MRRVALVTGGAGFIGSAAAAELRRRGWRVVAATRLDADLEDPVAAARLIARVRPAAIVHAPNVPKADDPKRLWAAHVGMTVNVLEAAAALERPPRVVVVGSAAEYGDACGAKPAREDGPMHPVGAYGAAKRAQTLAALSYRHRGLGVVVARVFNSCGPGSPARLVPGAFVAQLTAIRRGARPAIIETGDLSPARDFIDIRDIAAALAALCEARAPAGAYNVCSGRATQIRVVLDMLLNVTGIRATIRRLPGRAAPPRVSVGDNAKLRRATGWKPRISLEQSLRDALR